MADLFYICWKDAGNETVDEKFVIGTKEEALREYQKMQFKAQLQEGDYIELSYIEQEDAFDLILHELYNNGNTDILTNIATDYF